jgi:hypothetical protein
MATSFLMETAGEDGRIPGGNKRWFSIAFKSLMAFSTVIKL